MTASRLVIYFSKQNFIGTHLCPFIYILSMGFFFFLPLRPSWIVVTETKLEIFNLWPFKKKKLLLNLLTNDVEDEMLAHHLKYLNQTLESTIHSLNKNIWRVTIIRHGTKCWWCWNQKYGSYFSGVSDPMKSTQQWKWYNMDFCTAAVDLWESIEGVDFTGGWVVKTLPANAGDVGLIPGSGRSLWEGNGNPL